MHKRLKFFTLSTVIINESRSTEASTHTKAEGKNCYQLKLIGCYHNFLIKPTLSNHFVCICVGVICLRY